MYQFLSDAFLYPGEELLSLIEDETFAANARDWVRRLPEREGEELARSMVSLVASLEGSLPADLQGEYRRIFGHTVSKDCPPYETEYGKAHIFQQASEMADIGGFYRAFGLEASEENRDRLDHISTELEFMHVLAYKEAHALEYHGEEKGQLCREAQQKFLNEHLGRWALYFVGLLSKKAETGFYRELASLTKSFMTFEARFLEAAPDEVRELSSAAFEPEFTCQSDGDALLAIEGMQEGR